MNAHSRILADFDSCLEEFRKGKGAARAVKGQESIYGSVSKHPPFIQEFTWIQIQEPGR